MKPLYVIIAMTVIALVAYFLGMKKSKNAFQFLTEDNGNFSLIRLLAFLSFLAFWGLSAWQTIKTGTLPNPSWSMVVLLSLCLFAKVIQKYLESNPEKINEIIQVLRK